MKFENWTNQYIKLVEAKPEYVFQLPRGELEGDDPARWSERLARYPRRFCEIGCGSGGHLIELAKRNPHVLCFGFELRFKRAYKTAEKAQARGLKNVTVFRADGRRVFDLLPPESLERVYVNFPDPWEKRVWRNRRIMSGEFFRRMSALLVPGGRISYKTDHSAYFDETVKLAASVPGFSTERVSRDLAASPYEDGNIATEFERLFRSQGQPIHFAEFRRD